MRIAILAVLLIATPSHTTLAQTIDDNVFATYRNQQVADYLSIVTNSEILGAVLHVYGSVSEANEHDRAILRLSALESLHLVEQMHSRAKKMFDKVEHDYEQHCLNGIIGPMPCSEYRTMYRAMIADTLMLGSFYYSTTEGSHEILSILRE